VGGRGGFKEEVEDGCGRLMDEAAAALSNRRRSQKRDKAARNKTTTSLSSSESTHFFLIGGNVSQIFMFSVFCFHVCKQRSVKRSHGQKKREEKKKCSLGPAGFAKNRKNR